MPKLSWPLWGLIALLGFDFLANAWVGVGFFSERKLNVKQFDAGQFTTSDAIDRVQFPASLFGIENPILVGQSAKEAKRLADIAEQERLAKLRELAQQETKITSIKANDYDLRLVATSFRGEQSYVLIEAAKKSASATLLSLAAGEVIFDVFRIERVEFDAVVLKPVIKEDTSSDFQQIKLYIYKPNLEKEIL